MSTAAQSHPVAHGHQSTGAYIGVFVALLALLLATVAVARFELGVFAFPVALAIATVKAVLILLYFMHLRFSTILVWIVAAGTLLWVAILFDLTLADYLTRGVGFSANSP